MRKCNCCGKKISEFSKVCPYCGFDFESGILTENNYYKRNTEVKKVILINIVIVVILGMANSILSHILDVIHSMLISLLFSGVMAFLSIWNVRKYKFYEEIKQNHTHKILISIIGFGFLLYRIVYSVSTLYYSWGTDMLYKYIGISVIQAILITLVVGCLLTEIIYLIQIYRKRT